MNLWVTAQFAGWAFSGEPVLAKAGVARLEEGQVRGPSHLSDQLRLLVLTAGLALFCPGCRPPTQPPGKELARVGEVSISQEAFEALLQSRAGSTPDRFSTLAAKAALLDEMIDREAALAKARAAGFDQRPDIQESVKRLIASKFLDEQRKRSGAADPSASEAEIQGYYQQHADKYATPAKVRGAVLFLKLSPLAEAEKREQLLARAQALLTQARTATPADFARLVEANSEDQATRYRGGDLGWMSRETKAEALDASVLEALLALQKPGDFAGPVATRKGVYIVKLLDTQSAGTRPLPEVREAIAFLLRKQKLEQRERDLLASMRVGLDIRINRPVLETIRLPSVTDQTPPASPGVAVQTR